MLQAQQLLLKRWQLTLAATCQVVDLVQLAWAVCLLLQAGTCCLTFWLLLLALAGPPQLLLCL
jgi:hypothetical protein